MTVAGDDIIFPNLESAACGKIPKKVNYRNFKFPKKIELAKIFINEI